MQPAIPATLETAPVIRRSEYQPPAWLVPSVLLDFQLDAAATKVRARIEMRRAVV